MTEFSKIEWCDHSHNHWVGCEAISTACLHCYAEAWAKRAGRDFAVRQLTTEMNRRKPIKWNSEHEAWFAEHGRKQRVFCNSLADVFDKKVPAAWRESLFELIRATPNLNWLILTKRIGNAARMLPNDWGNGYPNVWLGSTVVTRPEYLRDVKKLRRIPARVRFLSVEPMVEDLGRVDLSGILWLITGGETGGGARPLNPMWARSLRDQCLAADVAYFHKQNGVYSSEPGQGELLTFNDAELTTVRRVGKLKAGRLLDGRTWDQFPTVAA